MTLRKGQHLFNEISKKYKLKSQICEHGEFPYYDLHQVLFYMEDKEYDEIMNPKIQRGLCNNPKCGINRKGIKHDYNFHYIPRFFPI